ncbi:MAG: glycosyltransferase family 39 protein [Pseudomonadota bacterium]|nr:glycosyltransferase family 39 protein [Pseudomonadota bacterium]
MLLTALQPPPSVRSLLTCSGLLFLGWTLVAWLTGALGVPADGDEIDYLQRGLTLVSNDSLADAYRPPLYPLVIWSLGQLLPQPLVLDAARLLNILLVSIVPGLWLWYAGRSPYPGAGLLMALFSALWPPFYLYAFNAMAEAPSFLFWHGAILLTLLAAADAERSSRRPPLLPVTLAGVCLGLLGLLKANNILVAAPLALMFWLLSPQPRNRRLRALALMAAAAMLVVSPWLLYVKHHTGQWRVTTTGGINLMLGSGRYDFGMGGDPNTLQARYLAAHPSAALEQEVQQRIPVFDSTTLPRDFIDDQAREMALDIWRRYPQVQRHYGLLKVLHSFGFSLRGPVDYVTAGFFLVATLVALAGLWSRALRPLAVMHLGCTLCGALMAFFFLPNIRFKTFYFDTTGLLLIAHALGYVLLQHRRRRRDHPLTQKGGLSAPAAG